MTSGILERFAALTGSGCSEADARRAALGPRVRVASYRRRHWLFPATLRHSGRQNGVPEADVLILRYDSGNRGRRDIQMSLVMPHFRRPINS
jgi:hypothetical protein